ncbi:hypothetical protein ILYODFUR_016250 [Ilyodon furcidens]|uniref:Uncharacterized protein n=1 Tax=Ilyodon furcidens TaxID=33524 RepID=A0ABV0TZ89_9TELE
MDVELEPGLEAQHCTGKEDRQVLWRQMGVTGNWSKIFCLLLDERWLEWRNDLEPGRTEQTLLRKRLMEMRNTCYPPHQRILAASSGDVFRRCWSSQSVLPSVIETLNFGFTSLSTDYVSGSFLDNQEYLCFEDFVSLLLSSFGFASSWQFPATFVSWIKPSYTTWIPNPSTPGNLTTPF